jgi:hypothetical protein
MKNISVLILIITLICGSKYYSQSVVYTTSKEDRLKIKENSKGLSLKIGDLKSVEKNGKTSWTIKSTLTNHSHDTVFYFIIADCEPANFMAMPIRENISLFADFDPCGDEKQTVISLPPKGQRTVDVMFSSQQPVTSSFKFIVFLHLAKANNSTERIPHGALMRMKDRVIFLHSNKVKVNIPSDKQVSKRT